MKVVTVAQVRELDERTIEEFGITGETLMERAGKSVARAVEGIIRASGLTRPFVLLAAGKGNNGGDAFAAARHLRSRGLSAEVWLAGESGALRGDAARHFNLAKARGVPIQEHPDGKAWTEALASFRPLVPGVIVDGLLGTGFTGTPRSPASECIAFMNAAGLRNAVVAIDAPSGLNADTGAVMGEAVRADITVTMGLPKRGLLAPGAMEFVGNVQVADIGIPEELIAAVESDLDMIALEDLRRLVSRRPRGSHKGMFGNVLIIGGAAGYTGAATLASLGALRSGVGLVTALVPSRLVPVVACAAPEAMVHGAPETESGSLAANCLDRLPRGAAEFDAVLLGPGLTAHDESRLLVKRVLDSCVKPLVLDADALNCCAGRAGLIGGSRAPTIITPHPGEMARLLGCDTSDVQRDRPGSARRAAEATHGTVVLKGAGTLIAGGKAPLTINTTGNPGMASGGMGDVLSGLIAGFAAQGLTPYDAARLGVYLHGQAADLAAWRMSQPCITASDVLQEIPRVFRTVAPR